MNQTVLMGNLGADPELRQTEGGPLLKLRMATTERIKKKDEWTDHTEWHQITIWGKRAERLAEILEKGMRILVVGRLRTRSYEKDGDKRYSTEIHADSVELCGSKSNMEKPPRQAAQRGRGIRTEDPFEGYR